MNEVQVSYEGRRYSFGPGQTVRIGRSSDNDVVVSDPTVSRQHARLAWGPDGWVFEGQGRAGTFLRGSTVTRLVLREVVELSLGSAQGPVLQIEPAPLPPTRAATGLVPGVTEPIPVPGPPPPPPAGPAVPAAQGPAGVPGPAAGQPAAGQPAAGQPAAGQPGPGQEPAAHGPATPQAPAAQEPAAAQAPAGVAGSAGIPGPAAQQPAAGQGPVAGEPATPQGPAAPEPAAPWGPPARGAQGPSPAPQGPAAAWPPPAPLWGPGLPGPGATPGGPGPPGHAAPSGGPGAPGQAAPPGGPGLLGQAAPPWGPGPQGPGAPGGPGLHGQAAPWGPGPQGQAAPPWGPGAPGQAAPPGRPGARGGPGAPGERAGPPAGGSRDELASAFQILVPIKSWLTDPGWRQGIRLLVIPYALLPLVFLALFTSSGNLTTPGWAYSLYVAPLWAIAFWLLIRPGESFGRQEALIAGGIIVWVMIWMSVVTININTRLNPKSLGAALVLGVNEEITKALPILVAALLLLKLRSVKLDVRMWMFLGTIAGLTFGVREASQYTTIAIEHIAGAALAHSANAAVVGALSFAYRVFVDGFQHAIWAGLSAFFIGIAVNYPRRRVPLIIFGITMAAVLHGVNDWYLSNFASPWPWILLQAFSLFLFLGYTMSAASIEREVRRTPLFRGESMIMDKFTGTGDLPRS